MNGTLGIRKNTQGMKAWICTLTDPDLQIRGGGRSQKITFRPFWYWYQFGLKIWEDPSPGSATAPTSPSKAIFMNVFTFCPKLVQVYEYKYKIYDFAILFSYF